LLDNKLLYFVSETQKAYYRLWSVSDSYKLFSSVQRMQWIIKW